MSSLTEAYEVSVKGGTLSPDAPEKAASAAGGEGVEDMRYEALKLKNQLCFPLYACSREVIRQYKPYLDQIDLTYTQYIAMMVLWEHHTVMAKDIGKFLFLDSGTLTPLLKRLEKKGLLRRQRAPEDERNLLVTITPEGEALRERAADIPCRMAEQTVLSEEEAGTLYRLLYRMLDEAEKSR